MLATGTCNCSNQCKKSNENLLLAVNETIGTLLESLHALEQTSLALDFLHLLCMYSVGYCSMS